MITRTECIALLKQLCVPAGEGVFTVHTGAQYKTSVQRYLYGGSGELAHRNWQIQLETLSQPTLPTMLLGVCSDVGGGIRRGANWGPTFIRDVYYSEPLSVPLLDLGDVRVIPQLLHDSHLAPALIKKCRKALYGDDNIDLPVSALSITEKVLSSLYEAVPRARVCALGGDHSVSYPLVKAYLLSRSSKRVAVIHFDAHTDLLVERMGVDITFASWAAHILPYLQSPRDLIQIGIRSSSKDKRYWAQAFGVTQHWMDDIKQKSIKVVIRDILTQLHEDQIEEVYVSADIDALDQSEAGATGTPEPGGLKADDMVQIIYEIGKVVPITGADLVEVAPMIAAGETEPTNTLNSAKKILSTLLTILNGCSFT